MSTRVAILTPNYPPEVTGVAPYVGALAKNLRERGFAVRVVTTHPHYPEWRIRPGYGEWSREDLVDGVPVQRVRHYVPRRPRSWQRLLSEVSLGLRLLTARWADPVVVVAVSPALFATAIAGWRSRRPQIVWVQDLYSVGMDETGQGGGRAGRFVTRVESRVLRGADRVVAIHERHAARIRALGVPEERIVTIRNWTHLPPPSSVDVNRVREEFGWRPGETIVLHAGNMGAKQGLENVVEAARIADDRELPVRFVLVGDGSKRATLREEAAGVERMDFVSLLPAETFAAALASADILLVNERPGVAEMSVPSKLTSYFDSGRPIIAATDPQGVTAAELAASNAGITVPAGRPQALLETILQLRADPQLAAEFGLNGRRYRASVLQQSVAVESFADTIARLASGE